MEKKLTFRKYQRSKNVRSSRPQVRVNRGYVFLNRGLLEALKCECIDLYVNRGERSVLIKKGDDFKLTYTANGRATFSAATFLNDLGIPDGFFTAVKHEDGFLFVYGDR